MDEKLTRTVIQSRDSLRKKLKSLKADIARAQRGIDIQYAPITEPLREIIDKLEEVTAKSKRPLVESLEEEEEESALSSDQPFEQIPGTSILKIGGTPSRKKHRVSWFSPTVHSSPTKRRRPKQFKESVVKKAPSFAQPSFIEDVFLSEPPEEKSQTGVEHEESEETEGSSRSLDLEKSMAHAISLLQKTPSKSIIANKSLNKTLLDTDIVKESLKEHDPIVRPYLMGLVASEKGEYDLKYGVREEGNALKVGTETVSFDGPYIIIGNFKYKGSRGLYELLFKKDPGKFTYADVRNYKYILKNTNSYRVGYDPDKKIAASSGHKYKNIIKPILAGKPPNVWWTRNWKVGAGILTMPSKKQVTPHSKVEYKYWDNLNQLCDRLSLLIASKQAGHSAHDNEIMNIIMELKEANVIE